MPPNDVQAVSLAAFQTWRRLGRDKAQKEYFAQGVRLATDLQIAAAEQGETVTLVEAFHAFTEAAEIREPGRMARCGIRRRPTNRIKTPSWRRTSCPPRTMAPATRTRGRRESAPKPSAKRTPGGSQSDDGPGEPPDGPADDGQRWPS